MENRCIVARDKRTEVGGKREGMRNWGVDRAVKGQPEGSWLR